MREFDRIKIDPNVANGLPCIRDTGISVSEIAKAIKSGKSFQEMKAIYFELDEEDIFQAQAYSLQKLVDEVGFWLHEGLVPIVSIRGFSELLAYHDKFPQANITGDQEKFFLQAIFQRSVQAISIWNHFSLWTRLSFEEILEWKTFTVQTLTSELEKDYFYKEYPSQFTFIPNPEVSTIKLTYALLFVIAFLVHHFDYDLAQEAVITFELFNNEIKIQVSRKIIKEHYRPSVLLVSDSQIAKLHGGKLDFTQTNENALFILRIPQSNSINQNTHE